MNVEELRRLIIDIAINRLQGMRSNIRIGF
jgi:hypothetical protein